MVVCDRPGEGIARLTLNRPDKKNVLSIALRDEVSDQLDQLGDDEAVKVVIVTGAGDTFSAGFDLKEFTAEDPAVQAALWPSSDRFHHTVLRFPLPTVAAVNGPALAGGFDLAVLCDVRLAAGSAVFAHPEHTFGDVVYAPLHDLVGGAVARDLCFTGRSIDAAEALRTGLVSRVVPDADLEAAALEVATQIALGTVGGARAHQGEGRHPCRDRGRHRHARSVSDDPADDDIPADLLAALRSVCLAPAGGVRGAGVGRRPMVHPQEELRARARGRFGLAPGVRAPPSARRAPSAC